MICVRCRKVLLIDDQVIVLREGNAHWGTVVNGRWFC
jgi:hypothetical protein